jgi:hypothetical protein
MKNKFLLGVLLILFLLGGLFYWKQIRPANIRKKCYLDVYVLNKAEAKQVEGKFWRVVGRDETGNYIWGWDYVGDSGEERFNGCLLLNKI